MLHLSKSSRAIFGCVLGAGCIIIIFSVEVSLLIRVFLGRVVITICLDTRDALDSSCCGIVVAKDQERLLNYWTGVEIGQ